MSAKPKQEKPVLGAGTRRAKAAPAASAPAADDLQALHERYYDLQAFREACLAVITSKGIAKRAGLLYLVQRLALGHDWPTGDEWRGLLTQILVTVTDAPLVARRGPKRKGSIAERNAAICAEYKALGLRGIRGDTRMKSLIERFGVKDETVSDVLKKRKPRGN